MKAKRKNKYGQYFTVGEIAEFMVSLIRHNINSKVLEPSCGKGVFLEKLTKYGFLNLSAYEIDASLNDPYSFVKYESFISSTVDDKFDVVIGNPPFIRWKNLEEDLRDELSRSILWNNYFNSLCDYLYIFILKSIIQLNDGGELIFITSDYWLNTKNSISLRNYMVQNGYFSDIYHFKEAKLFENVTASIVVFRYVKSLQKNNNISLFKYKGKGMPLLSDLLTRSCFDKSVIPQFKENLRWLLADKQQQEEMSNFEAKCARENKSDLFAEKELYKIGDFCDIGNGMVSGLDKAFKIDDISCLNKYEQACIIKIIKAKDLGKYLGNNISNYIFIPEGLTTKEFESKYTHFCEHFEPYVNELSERYQYGRKIPYWEFVFPRNKKNLFDRPSSKIFVPCKERISNKRYFRFTLASKDVYPLQDVTAIYKKNNCKESIEYILAYLNNRRIFDWLLFNGVIKGDIVEFSEAPIASIPYLPINWNEPQQVNVHNEIAQNVHQYIATRESIFLTKINDLFNKLFRL